jgi:RNA polymerase sigma-70 factor (ECF subfamily)
MAYRMQYPAPRMISNEVDIRNDLQLIEQFRNGDRNAFEQLVNRHYCRCVNLATNILRNRAEAEDEVQQAFWRAFEHLDQYLGEAEFSAWLLRIVVNECRMLMRTKQRARLLYLDGGRSGSNVRPIELLSPIADPEYEVIKRQMIEVLRTEIQHVPPFFRQVIMLHDLEGLTMLEAAERLGITVSAAKSRLLRARRELRSRLRRRWSGTRHMMPLASSQTFSPN